MTDRTGTKRIIKRKTSWFNLVNTDSTVRTGKTLTEVQLFFPNDINKKNSSSKLHYCFDRICQTILNSFLYHKAVYDNFNIMLLILL